MESLFDASERQDTYSNKVAECTIWVFRYHTFAAGPIEGKMKSKISRIV